MAAERKLQGCQRKENGSWPDFSFFVKGKTVTLTSDALTFIRNKKRHHVGYSESGDIYIKFEGPTWGRSHSCLHMLAIMADNLDESDLTPVHDYENDYPYVMIKKVDIPGLMVKRGDQIYLHEKVNLIADRQSGTIVSICDSGIHEKDSLSYCFDFRKYSKIETIVTHALEEEVRYEQENRSESENERENEENELECIFWDDPESEGEGARIC